ncbi:asparagine synthase-related protein [Dyadobacter soli]|uniref:asparagine synthase-related protein n=1 Tax=Dyadobacter soli TaxID=659014 RepID=UPI000B7DCC9C|nr:asparagine synthase-related protein [Dyadobacter soli]
MFNSGYIGVNKLAGNYPTYLVHTVDQNGDVQKLSNLREGNAEPLHLTELLSATPDLHIGVWYDADTRRLHLSRDVFGVVPFFYAHIPGKYFAFSTDIISLTRMREVAAEISINVGKIIPYCSPYHPDFVHDASSTFFSSIQSVLPGHVLTVDALECTSRRYVTFRPEKWAHLKKSEEYAEVLRSKFIKAVGHCVPDTFEPVGAQLSGGLDSSSVSSVAKRLWDGKALHTFHIVSQSGSSDESNYAEAVVNSIGSIHHLVYPPSNDLEALELSTRLYGQPEASFLSPASNLAMISSAAQHGCKVLLNGFGGDSVIGNGSELVLEAFNKQDWKGYEDLLRMRVKYFALADQYSNWDSFPDTKKYELVLQNSLYRRFSTSRDRSLGALLRLYRSLPGNLRPSPAYFLNRYVKSLFSRTTQRYQTGSNQLSIVHPEIEVLYGQKDVPTSFPTAIRSDLPASFQELFQDVFHPHVIKTQEEYFMLGNHFGVSSRSPFMDYELFELNLAIPDIVKFGDGIGRAHMRNAMKGILTDKVRLRHTKATLSSSDGHDMTMRLYDQAKHYLFDNPETWHYLDRQKFEEQVKIALNLKIPYSHKTNVYLLITRGISFAIWLDWLKKHSKNASSSLS